MGGVVLKYRDVALKDGLVGVSVVKFFFVASTYVRVCVMKVHGHEIIM